MEYDKLEQLEFRDVEFMTAREKESVLRECDLFLDSVFVRN